MQINSLSDLRKAVEADTEGRWNALGVLDAVDRLTSATPPDVANWTAAIVEVRKMVEQWAGSAFVADEGLSFDDMTDAESKSALYDDLCSIMNRLQWVEDEAATALRLSAGGGKTERRKFYHHGYSTAELLKARKSPPEFFTDDGEAWRYEYTHADGEGGAYDMLYRPASPTVEAGHVE